MERKINPDLIKERKSCTFNTLELTHLLDGGKEKTNKRKWAENYFLTDPELKSEVPMEYLSHKEKYEEAIRRTCVFFKKVQQFQNEDKGGLENLRGILKGGIGLAVLNDLTPLSLHYAMFIPTLMGQATLDQQDEWLQKSINGNIIGTYAQTELGHGTFIRGLETTATYCSETEEFVLNSPTLTSYKWWPGGLGNSTNYAIVVAQLYTKGKCYGIHPFIVQLRDTETHIPLPGIKIGELGCKFGMNSANNGYLGLENIRIPRTQMLMKNSQVLPDGTYVKSPSSKLTYGTMILVRVIMVENAADYLKKCATIATRYSAVRHQSKLRLNEPEPAVIDYVTQQYKLFPNIASCFAFHYTATWLSNTYKNVTSELQAGNLGNLPELHAVACVLKAVSTADATQGVDTLRLACGGHGYMTSSNLPTTYALVTAMCTYEGDNTVLLLQTARFLVKQWHNRENIQNLTTLRYLAYSLNKSIPFERSVEWVIFALQKTVTQKLYLACNRLNERVKKGQLYEDAWNNTSVELVEIAELHGRIIIVEKFYEAVRNLRSSISKELWIVLHQLLELYAVHTTLRCSGHLLMFTEFEGKDLEVVQSWLEELLALIRPNAVGIVDSFDIHDAVLSSTLGAYDGNVYERLFEEAQKSPLNAEPVNKSFQQYLKPFLKSNI